jgi:hypothetical protein
VKLLQTLLMTHDEALAHLGIASTENRLSAAELPRDCFVLLYRMDGEETIHTLHTGQHTLVIAFEHEFTARKFAQQLHVAVPPWAERFETAQIIEFCETSGYTLVMVPVAQVAHPPSGH